MSADGASFMVATTASSALLVLVCQGCAPGSALRVDEWTDRQTPAEVPADCPGFGFWQGESVVDSASIFARSDRTIILFGENSCEPCKPLLRKAWQRLRTRANDTLIVVLTGQRYAAQVDWFELLEKADYVADDPYREISSAYGVCPQKDCTLPAVQLCDDAGRRRGALAAGLEDAAALLGATP